MVFCYWLLSLNEMFLRFISVVRSDQIRSVTQSCPTLCDPMNHSTPGLPVHHQLPEFTQTHVHRVSDAIQPSHPLSSPFSSCPQSLPAAESFPMSQLFAWDGQSTGVGMANTEYYVIFKHKYWNPVFKANLMIETYLSALFPNLTGPREHLLGFPSTLHSKS